MARLSLRWITDTYFYDFEDTDVINQGWCFVWAWLAHLKHPRGQLFSYEEDFTHARDTRPDSHAFIKIGDYFYDSSRPSGTTKIHRLRWFKERDYYPECVRVFTPDAFRRTWEMQSHPQRWGQQKLVPWPAVLPDRPDLLL